MLEVVTTLISAGPFGVWLNQFRAALRSNAGTDVPCGDCRGCCRSGYPVPLRPIDRGALDAVPARFVTTLRTTRGLKHMMVALPDGRCPMLDEGNCAIYAARPQTCRDYDCRVFAAAGIEAGGDDRSEINNRVRAWRFSYEFEADRAAHEAVQRAATYIREHAQDFPVPISMSPSGIAVLAVKVYELFMDSTTTPSKDERMQSIIDAARSFDAGS